MTDTVLITGGAGFIGSHVADRLLAGGSRVRVLDTLDPQVHQGGGRPVYLAEEVDVVTGDVADPVAVREALEGVDSVIHLAAAVGVGQSMYRIRHYMEANAGGTATLLEALIERPARKLVVASSMSIYGEGRCLDRSGRIVDDATRSREALQAAAWEPMAEDGSPLRPVPTPEDKRPELSSVYALSKYDQERMCLMVGRAYDIPTIALRFFNVFGPRQALGNPYTGVLAIFATRYLNGHPPVIFEDGLQRRDFVNVHDVARAVHLALQSDAKDEVLNIGSGRSVTVADVAAEMGRALNLEQIEPQITGEYRVGDIRHCFADIGRARAVLDYEPQIDFAQGVQEIATWMEGQQVEDTYSSAHRELASRGLTLRQTA
jgi:dTDP-L-rhamnose 4-epimerase